MDVAHKLSSWMTDVLTATGWSAAEWARAANTSPTNIMRLLNKGTNAPLPNWETLCKLADAVPSETGIHPPRIGSVVELLGEVHKETAANARLAAVERTLTELVKLIGEGYLITPRRLPPEI